MRPRLFDPGWLFVLAGMALVGTCVILPSQARLEEARWQRDRARALESHVQERIRRTQRTIDAIENGNEATIRSLAASQLNLIPVGTRAWRDPEVPASPMADLEPEPPQYPPPPRLDTRLARWTDDPHTRLWLIGGGMLSILVGVLWGIAPRDTVSGGPGPAESDSDESDGDWEDPEEPDDDWEDEESDD
ncbi:MAG: hypothetical protein H6811_08070 [Phycisphaeraceae bacterium]|nr:hypothetical protein [Phycisphaeraceae bacterium]